MEDFRDPTTARKWSEDTVSYNPLREEQLNLLLSIVAAEYKPGDTIIDIGIGSGLVEEALFRHVPGARVLGIDTSEAMLALAAERLTAYKSRYSVLLHDLREISSLELPPARYSTAISIQTVHNIVDEYKQATFSFLQKALAPGGLFLLLDRIAVDTPALFDVYRVLWGRQGDGHSTALHEGATFEEHRRIVQARGDLPASLAQHLQWLRDAGFEAACLDLHGNRALFAGRKS